MRQCSKREFNLGAPRNRNRAPPTGTRGAGAAMNLSTWSIRHPVPPIAIFLVLVVLGLVSFLRLV